MEQTTASALQDISEVASQAADDFNQGMSEAIEGNQFIAGLKEIFEKYTTPANLVSLAAKVLIAVLILLVGYLLAKFIIRVTTKAMDKRKTDRSIYGFVATIIKFIVYIIAVVSALSSLGLNISSLIAALASIGVAIGLGLQGSVSQLVSGIILIVNKPFRKGDFIEVKGVAGSVSHIHIMYTTMHTADNKKVVMPNSDLTSNYIINYSALKTRRCDVKYGISYADDIDKARQIILNVVGSHPEISKEPAPVVLVSSHEASSIQLELRVWCSADDYWDVFFSLQEEVKLAFDKNGITIPFNQLDVHVTQ